MDSRTDKKSFNFLIADLKKKTKISKKKADHSNKILFYNFRNKSLVLCLHDKNTMNLY